MQRSNKSILIGYMKCCLFRKFVINKDESLEFSTRCRVELSRVELFTLSTIHARIRIDWSSRVV